MYKYCPTVNIYLSVQKVLSISVCVKGINTAWLQLLWNIKSTIMAAPESDTAYPGQTEEVANMKKIFPGCKVIKDVGDFRYVIDVKSDEMDLTVKFQIEESYPSTVPNIILKSTQMSSDEKEILTTHLQEQASSLINSAMMELLFKSAITWVQDRGIQVMPNSPHEKVVTQKGKKSGKGKNKVSEEKKPSKKLVSMKTATDVVSRIIWDEQLPMEHFVVGYLDRFVGIVERAFSTFTWEDLASVDYDALAIPKHRIHYFKYKGVKVWDKNDRMDNVFGSTGSGLTITDVMEKYENGEITADPDNKPMINDDNDSDSDEDLVITTGMEQPGEDGFLYPKEKYWGPKKRPTHFVCLRITDPSIIETVLNVRSTILDIEPGYEENIMPRHRLHITLCCLGLDTYEEINKASEIVHKIKPELEKLNPKNIPVELSGVDNFFHNVLYAKVKHNPDFLAFVRTLTLLFQESGIEIRDVFEFSPHMTLLKLKKQMQKEMKTRYLEPRLYDALADVNFGVQEVDNIYLCQMSEDRDEAGFYICPTHINF